MYHVSLDVRVYQCVQVSVLVCVRVCVRVRVCVCVCGCVAMLHVLVAHMSQSQSALQTRYDPESLPPNLRNFMKSSRRCNNPKCAGVYFTTSVKKVTIEDFCGKFRVPLMKFLCQERCSDVPSYPSHPTPATPSPVGNRKKIKISKVLLTGYVGPQHHPSVASQAQGCVLPIVCCAVVHTYCVCVCVCVCVFHAFNLHHVPFVIMHTCHDAHHPHCELFPQQLHGAHSGRRRRRRRCR